MTDLERYVDAIERADCTALLHADAGEVEVTHPRHGTIGTLREHHRTMVWTPDHSATGRFVGTPAGLLVALLTEIATLDQPTPVQMDLGVEP